MSTHSTPALFKNYGLGVGLRQVHHSVFLAPDTQPSSVSWLEVISESFMNGKIMPNTKAMRVLEKIRENYQIALHGVSLNIGSTNDLDLDYLKELKKLIDHIDPIVVSDHLCWTKIHGVQTHDLNPLPYTESLVTHVADKIKRVQDLLGRRILIENVSSYLTFEASEMREEEFIRAVSERSDSGILLDVNNVFVSSINHGLDPKKFLEMIPRHRVGQIHMAGHTVEENGFLVDTHDHPVRDEVWALFDWYGKNFGHPSSMIERDANIPEWGELEKEILKMGSLFQEKSGFEIRSVATSPINDDSIQSWKSLQEKWVDSLYGDFEVTGIVNKPPMSAESRFEVYDDSFWARFEQVLAEDFPLFKAQLLKTKNQDVWNSLVLEIQAYSWTISELGEVFLNHVRNSESEHLSLAEEDWARVKARFFSHEELPENTQSHFAALAELDPVEISKVKLILHPSAQLIAISKKVIWNDSMPHETLFDSSDWGAVEQIRAGIPMVQIAEKYPKFHEKVPSLVQSGLICGFR